MSDYQSLLGIARRANKIVYGDQVMASIRSQQAKLVLIAQNASTRTQKQLVSKCAHYGISFRMVESYEELSSCIGKYNVRSVAITDSGLAEEIIRKI